MTAVHSRARKDFRAPSPAVAAAALLAAVVATASALPACAETASREPPRVVSLVPAVTETMFALGRGDSLVGVSVYCDQPEAARSLPKVGTFTEPVAEAIVALAPDLVLTSPSPGNENAVRAIERTGIEVLVVRSEGGLAEARTAMLEVAKAVGAEEEGAKLIAAIDARLAVVSEAVHGLPRPKVAVVIGREPLVLAGPASYLGELVTIAGGINVAESPGGRWPRVGMEYLVEASPAVVVDLAWAMGEAGPGAAREPDGFWRGLVGRSGATPPSIVGDPESVTLRPGPRLAEAAELLARAFHPGAFDAVRSTSTAR